MNVITSGFTFSVPRRISCLVGKMIRLGKLLPWIFTGLLAILLVFYAYSVPLGSPFNRHSKIPSRRGSFSSVNHLNIECFNKTTERRVYQRSGSWWVVENFLTPSNHEQIDCGTVTYALYAEFDELYRLLPLLDRWRAPISLTLFCPRRDYKNCLESLNFMRNCLAFQSQMYFLRKYLFVHLLLEGEGALPKKVRIRMKLMYLNRDQLNWNVFCRSTKDWRRRT